MGQAFHLSCGCGYQKDVFVGEGMMSMTLPKIRKVFAEADLSGFERAVANGEDYGMGSKIAYCAKCDGLVSASVLRYTEEGETKVLNRTCPDCGGEVVIRETAGNCPKCGKALREDQSGRWD